MLSITASSPPRNATGAGKPPNATLTISARRQGNRLVIEVRDDGRGLAPDAIRDAAVARGIATRAEVDALPDADALDLVFRPGFSTAGTRHGHLRAWGRNGCGTHVHRPPGRASVTVQHPGGGNDGAPDPAAEHRPDEGARGGMWRGSGTASRSMPLSRPPRLKSIGFVPLGRAEPSFCETARCLSSTSRNYLISTALFPMCRNIASLSSGRGWKAWPSR